MDQSDFKKLLIQEKLVLPPMCGYTDYPYRKILARFGGSILITEMIKARAILINNERTMKMLVRSEEEPCTGAQLLGSEPEIMARAAIVCQGLGFSFVDINLGCPAKKVLSRQEGGALLKNPDQIGRILRAVRQAIDIPLTIKIRLGFWTKELTALVVARIAEENGVDAITVHGRSVEQGYSGLVDLQRIKEVAQSVSVPVIANGGIGNEFVTREILQQTGAIAVMPGRAILGNPWLIGEILHQLHGREIGQYRSIDKIKETALEHFNSLAKFYNERSACLSMRRFLSLYFKGTPCVVEMRRKLNALNSRSDFILLLDEASALSSPN